MKKKRICIASPDLIGPVRNGGIGSACFELAKLWNRSGHKVTCLFVSQQKSNEAAGDQWRETYANLGITFVYCPNDKRNGFYGPYQTCQLPWSAWIWLRQQDFDVIYFPEWRAVGLYAIQAKAAGLDFANTHIIVGVHSSTYWSIEGCGRTPENISDLVQDAAERQSVVWCDTVISPSSYLLEYMKENEWTLPSDLKVIPNPIEPASNYERFEQVSEIVFFARLEYRKGLRQFIDAVHLLPREFRKLLRITFLGKEGDFPGGAKTYIEKKNNGEFADWKILDGFNSNEALEYLNKPTRLAVMPSLVENSPMTVRECLALGIPFIASNVGGICELIDERDIDRSTFNPTPQGIASALRRVIMRGAGSIRSAIDEQKIDEAWNRVLDQWVAKPSKILLDAEVSVVLVTHNRSDMLRDAIDGLRKQTIDNFEVVLVDDGSTNSNALEYIDSLYEEFESRGWKIIRQNNAYLGAARNAGWRAAKGKIIIFHDDDNYSSPELVETYRNAIKHSNADIVTCAMSTFSGSRPNEHPFESMDVFPVIGNAYSAGMHVNAFGDAHAAFKREVLEKIGGFTEDVGVGHEDWEIFAKAALKNFRILHIPRPMFWYRVSADSMLRTQFSPMLDLLRSFRPYLEQARGILRPALTYAIGLSHAAANPTATPPTTTDEQNAALNFDFEGLEAVLARSFGKFYLQPADDSTMHAFIRLCISNLGRGQYDVILMEVAKLLPKNSQNLSLWELLIAADIRCGAGKNSARIFSLMPALAMATEYLSVARFDLSIIQKEYHGAFTHFAEVYNEHGFSDAVLYMNDVLNAISKNQDLLNALDDLICNDPSKSPSRIIVKSFLGVDQIFPEPVV
jgi:glycosyltransferase involved in cell wall biosynthesis/GT2 family glycosyltransferase